MKEYSYKISCLFFIQISDLYEHRGINLSLLSEHTVQENMPLVLMVRRKEKDKPASTLKITATRRKGYHLNQHFRSFTIGKKNTKTGTDRACMMRRQKIKARRLSTDNIINEYNTSRNHVNNMNYQHAARFIYQQHSLDSKTINASQQR